MSHPTSPPSSVSSVSGDASADIADMRDYLASLPNEKPITFFSKLWDKTKRDPLVPIGALATLAALTGGVVSFSRNQSALQQRWMQARVAAQAFTLSVLVFGFYQSGLLMPRAAREEWLQNKADKAQREPAAALHHKED